MVCARSNDCSSGTTSETAFLLASSKLPPRPFSGLLFWFANQQAMGAEHRHLFDNPQPQHADFHTKRWSAERDQRRGRRGSDVDERRSMPGFRGRGLAWCRWRCRWAERDAGECKRLCAQRSWRRSAISWRRERSDGAIGVDVQLADDGELNLLSAADGHLLPDMQQPISQAYKRHPDVVLPPAAANLNPASR